MEYPTYYDEHQSFHSMNDDCRVIVPAIQHQYMDNQNRPEQHLAYSAHSTNSDSHAITSSDIDSITMLNMNYMNQPNRIMNSQIQQPMTMVYGDGLSLSASSVCSSVDVCSPDIHPDSDIKPIGIPSDMVAQVIAQNSSSSPTINHQSNNMISSQQTGNIDNSVLTWPSSTMTNDTTVSNIDLMINHQTPSLETPCHLSSDAMTHTEDLYLPRYESMSSDQSVDTHLSSFHLAADTYVSSLEQNDDENQDNLIRTKNENQSASMRKPSSLRRNTVSLPCSDNLRAPTEKELRRQSINDLQKKPNVHDQLQSSSFCHLSREQLIRRVVELEKEKWLSSGLLESSSPVPRSAQLEVSDEEDFHSCHWSGCDTSTASLDQLITHIKDVHIGSGKAAYFCQWEFCPREQKPFLKRHKMQNHMRTHTGERPFECTVEGCDKRFSRPDSLNTHIKTHSSIRPYACPVENCSKAYFHSRSLRKHAKSHEALHTLSSLANATPATMDTSTTTKPAENRGEDIIVHRQHPYGRSVRPPRYYHQQQSCGSEALQQTPTHATRFTPMVINNDERQHTPSVKIMQNYEQQTFAAGTAYSRLQQQQLPYQQHQLLYQEEKSQQAHAPFGSSLSPQQYYQQQYKLMQHQNTGYNYIY